MQFWYTKIGNFYDDLMFLNKWHHSYTEIHKLPDDFMSWTRYAIFIRWIFCIFGVPFKKMYSTNRPGTLSWVRNNKNLKITKKQLTHKFCNADNIFSSYLYTTYLIFGSRGGNIQPSLAYPEKKQKFTTASYWGFDLNWPLEEEWGDSALRSPVCLLSVLDLLAFLTGCEEVPLLLFEADVGFWGWAILVLLALPSASAGFCAVELRGWGAAELVEGWLTGSSSGTSSSTIMTLLQAAYNRGRTQISIAG